MSEGDVISAADFDKLSWNTAHNDGGSFRFVPLDANQKPILGASAQTITVSESPAARTTPLLANRCRSHTTRRWRWVRN